MNKIKKIYFDMDGVLADFDLGVKELANTKPINQNDRNESNEDEMWNSIRRVENFYYKLKPINNMIDIFNEVKNMYPNCVEILSAIPKEKRKIIGAKEDKIKWVKKYLGDDIIVNIVYKEEKKNYSLGKEYVLIDDYKKNINEWVNENGTGILFDKNTNIINELEKLSKKEND